MLFGKLFTNPKMWVNGNADEITMGGVYTCKDVQNVPTGDGALLVFKTENTVKQVFVPVSEEGVVYTRVLGKKWASVTGTSEETEALIQNAIDKANQAQTKADTVDTRLNNIIVESGTSDAEVVAARTDSNGQTFTTLGVRLDTQFGEIKKDLSENVGGLKSALTHDFDTIIGISNLLEKATIIKGKAINSNGEIETNSSYSYIENIPVNKGIYSFVNNKTSTSGTTRIHGYHEGTWVSQLYYGSYINPTILVNVPDGIDQLKISYNHTTTELNTIIKGYLNINDRINSDTITLHLERGSYTSGNNYYGDSSSFSNYVINQFPIKINGATFIKISGLPDTVNNVALYLLNADGTRIRYDNYRYPNNVILPIKDTTADHINVSFPYFDFNKYNVKITAYKLNNFAQIEEVKRIYTNSNNSIIKYFMVDEDDGIYTAFDYMLPPNYSYNGKKVPIILWFDGNTGYSSMSDPFNQDKLPGLSYLRDEGYAIIQIFAWGSYFVSKYPHCGQDQPYPIPTNLKMIKAGLDYFTDRYNVDSDNIHIVSKSVGGIISTFFVSNPLYPFKSISMFAPVVDFISMRGRYSDAKKALAEELNLTGDLISFYDAGFQYFSIDGETFWTLNKDKLVKLNPAWTNLIGTGLDSQFASSFADARTWWADKASTSVYDDNTYKKIGRVPVKIWGSSDDAETPYQIMPELVKQLQNAGCFAVMRTLPDGTGGHSSADIDNGNNVIASITTELGITYTNVPIGWVEAMEWIRLNSMKF